MRLYFSILMCLCTIQGIAQTDTTSEENPFELENRILLKKGSVSALQGNPFEVRGSSALLRGRESFPQVARKPGVSIKDITPGLRKKTDLPARVPVFFFWMYLGLLFFLTLLVTGGRTIIRNMMKCITSDNLLKLTYREHRNSFQYIYLFFYLFFILNVSIFIYQALKAYGYTWSGISPWNILLIYAGVFALLVVMKYQFHFMIEHIFQLGNVLHLHLFLITLINGLLGLLLFPVNIILSYGSLQIETLLIQGVIVLAGLLYLLWILRGLNLGSRYILRHGFHFIIYLCSAEIAPLLILVRFLMNRVL